MLVFLVLGVAGMALLIVSVVAGEVFDLLDGALSGTGLGAGLTVFGASGVLARSIGWPASFTFPVAIVAGVLAMLVLGFVVRRLQNSDDPPPADPTGLTGRARTRVTTHSGEVSLDGPGELESRLATSDHDIPAGTRVRVIEAAGFRVRVEALPADPDRKD